jgi:PAS domain S-box-containing protein
MRLSGKGARVTMHQMIDYFENIEQDRAIRLILEGTAADVGARFFESLVEKLSQVLNTHGAWVTEFIEAENRLNALAFVMQGQWLNQFSYDIAGTACERIVVEKQLLHIPDRLLELYKGNTDVADLGAILRRNHTVSYLGVPLTDADERILGHLAVVDSRPIPNHPKILNVIRIFAHRASAELQRLNAEKQVHLSEARFRKLFDSTMDAIIEFDQTLMVTRVNPAAEELFQFSSGQYSGKHISEIFAAPEIKKVEVLVKTIGRQAEERKNLYIPGGLTAIAAEGDPCPTEGTLSKFEFGNSSYFILILRNEKERIEAQQMIQRMSVEAQYLQDEVRTLGNYDQIIGESQPLIEVLHKVRQVSATDAAVLITGETGTGKEAIARAIHTSGNRSGKPLITVNCAAIPSSLIESEFFGHEKGAFTGAGARRQGRFALADKGTIFLDEIGELPIDMQVKLLRVLQEGEFEPVGTSATVRVDVRVIAATNRLLADEIQKGNFREDLFYRLNVFPIELPPLRVRGEDIILLASYFLSKFSRRMGRPVTSLSPEDKRMLMAYPWPGNVRELQNVIERAVIVSSDGGIDLRGTIPPAPAHDPPGGMDQRSPASPTYRLLTGEDLKLIEKENMILALEKTGWRVSGEKGAARLLGMNPSTFASRMKTLGVVRP